MRVVAVGTAAAPADLVLLIAHCGLLGCFMQVVLTGSFYLFIVIFFIGIMSILASASRTVPAAAACTRWVPVGAFRVVS